MNQGKGYLMRTTALKTAEQQGFPEQHRELCSVL